MTDSTLSFKRLYIAIWGRGKTSFIQKFKSGCLVQTAVSSLQYNIKNYYEILNDVYEPFYVPDARILALGDYDWLHFKYEAVDRSLLLGTYRFRKPVGYRCQMVGVDQILEAIATS